MDIATTMSTPTELSHEITPGQLTGEETRERDRSALYERLLSLDPKHVREMLVHHLRRCTEPTCPTCCRVRARAAHRKLQRQKSQTRLRQWRGVAKSIGPMFALRSRAANTTYAPGGRGYHAARYSFESTRNTQGALGAESAQARSAAD